MTTQQQRTARPRALVAVPARRPSPSKQVPAAAPEQNLSRAVAQPLRAYRREDLMAVAEIGYHYLFSGGYQLALTLFEGLHAVDPAHPYFASALGLTHDHLGNPEEAERWYRKAAELDPTDGRPDVNRAELRIARQDLRKARELLIRGVNKARARRDQPLERKARALLKHLERAI